MATANKNAFMLSSATLMLNRFGDSVSVFDLNPTDHSVGLAKEITVAVDSSNLDLTAGVAQALVDSKKTNVQTAISATVQEFTAANFLRAQGFGSGEVVAKRGKLTAQVTAAGVSLSVADSPIPGEATSSLGTAAGAVAAGASIIIQHATIPELVFVAKASAASTYSTSVHTIPIANTAIPIGMTFPIDSLVWIVSEVAVGSVDQGDLFSVKIVGTLANFNRPVVYVAPKVQITKGFNLSFTETEYGSMPWEMRGLLLSASEATGRLAEIGTRAPGKAYAA